MSKNMRKNTPLQEQYPDGRDIIEFDFQSVKGKVKITFCDGSSEYLNRSTISSFVRKNKRYYKKLNPIDYAPFPFSPPLLLVDNFCNKCDFNLLKFPPLKGRCVYCGSEDY